MATIGVFYATHDGQTRRVAEHVGLRLRKHGLDVEVENVKDYDKDYDGPLTGYAGVVLAASVHAGHHEKEMIKFATKHRTDLERIPHAFLSVTLSEAGVERRDATPAERTRFAADVQKMLDEFVRETGWRPNRVKPVAGALLYRKYNFLLRFIMKRIARKAGGDTDTTRNYEYTDWVALDHFADDLATAFAGSVKVEMLLKQNVPSATNRRPQSAGSPLDGQVVKSEKANGGREAV